MKNVAAIADDIIRREGGYVNDPDDPGGATSHGVTLATLQRLGLDLNGDHKIDRSDVRAMTADRARRIFIREFFLRPQIDKLPKALQASVFDMYVNAGANAVKILQRLLRDMGQIIVVDGLVGPQTISAANAAYRMAPDHLADAYGIARRNYYYSLADHRQASRKYARRRDGGKGGWIRRAEEFIAPLYHLSDAQHRQRIASWG